MNHDIPQCSMYQVQSQRVEKKLLLIIGISLVVMVVMVGEIAGGTIYGSMALLADGWHMGTHVLALGLAFFACALARRIAKDKRFGFGPSKVSALGGFAGALLLALVAFEMVGKGIHRLLYPESIRFMEAIVVAAVGLTVNAVGALLLHDVGHGVHLHGDMEHHHGHGHDDNMRSAYLHVITDALTSVLAIAALLLGRQFGWVWADAAVAMLGGVIILKWAFGLFKSSGATLLDFVPGTSLRKEIKRTIQGEQDHKITDLHIFPQGNRFGLLATVKRHHNTEPVGAIHQRLSRLGYLTHVTVEVHPCDCC